MARRASCPRSGCLSLLETTRSFAWLLRLRRLEATLFEVSHQLRLIRKCDAALFSLTEGFRMKKVAAFLFGFVLLDTYAILICLIPPSGFSFVGVVN